MRYEGKDEGCIMIDDICPICKTAIKETKEDSVQCTTCQAVISDDAKWESSFGYEWVKELKEIQDAQS